MRKLAPIVLVFLIAAGCAGWNRQRAIGDAMIGLNAGRDSLIVWQEGCQEKAVATATTETMANELAKACRDKRDQIVKLFVIAYNALALAAVDPGNSLHYLEAVAAVKAVYDAVKPLLQE